MVPVNEVGSEGQPQLLISNLPPASTRRRADRSPSRGSTSANGPARYVVVGAQQDEFDYPTGEGDTGGSIGTETRWTGTTGIKLDNDADAAAVRRALPRPRPADQRPGHRPAASSCSTARSSDRLPLIAPFLRYDKDPYLVIDDAGRLVYVQDAYTTSRPVPERPGVRPRRAASTGRARRATTSTTSATASRSRSTPTTARCTSTSPTRRPDHPRLRRASSRRCSSRCRRCRPTSSRTSACPRTCSTSRPAMFGRYHVTNTQQFFRARRPVDGADADERADPAVRGVLRRDAAARRERRRVPAAPADGPDRPAEHDRVGRRPDGRARTTGRSRSTASRPTRRSSGRPRSRHGSTRTR